MTLGGSTKSDAAIMILQRVQAILPNKELVIRDAKSTVMRYCTFYCAVSSSYAAAAPSYPHTTHVIKPSTDIFPRILSVPSIPRSSTVQIQCNVLRLVYCTVLYCLGTVRDQVQRARGCWASLDNSKASCFESVPPDRPTVLRGENALPCSPLLPTMTSLQQSFRHASRPGVEGSTSVANTHLVHIH